MTIRKFGTRAPETTHTDPIALANGGRPPVRARVIRHRAVQSEQLTIAEPDEPGMDPYNGTGRFLVDVLRKQQDDS